MARTLRRHWREIGIEAALLFAFMLSALGFTALLEHPASPVRAAVPDALVRRALVGAAMGLTAIALIYSPWGARSGAHFNPAVTLTFLRLGKVDPHVAAGYVTAQFAGGLAGVLLGALVALPIVADPTVHYVATLPGPAGGALALVAEIGISFGLMLVVLFVANHPRYNRLTGLCAGVLVAVYITLEGPISGMSMNPARTVGSNVPAGEWATLWIYFAGPLAGMLLAAEAYARARGVHRVFCAKLNHLHAGPCLFRCRFHELIDEHGGAAAPPATTAPGANA